MNKTLNDGPKAALNDTRFTIPFNKEDHFYDIEMVKGDFDILSLKRKAEENALKRAAKIKVDTGLPTLTDKVFSLLSIGRYRRGPVAFNESARPVCQKQLEWCEEHGEPITLTLSFFPFKMTNPLKTFSTDGTNVDLSEVGSILRFYEIALGLSQFYNPGAKIIITADGVKYHDVFRYKIEDAQKYLENVKKLIKYLGVSNYVEIIEESSLYPEDIEPIKQRCIEEVKKEYLEGVPDTVELFRKLRCNIALTLNCRGIDAPVKTIASVFNSKLCCDDLINLDPKASLLRTEFEYLANEATFKYMGTHRVGYECDIYNKNLPHTLKATIHPKMGQIGLYAINISTDNYFPHHGQGHMTLDKKINKLDNIRVSFAADLRRKNVTGNIKGLILDPIKYPFSDGIHPFTFFLDN